MERVDRRNFTAAEVGMGEGITATGGTTGVGIGSIDGMIGIESIDGMIGIESIDGGMIGIEATGMMTGEGAGIATWIEAGTIEEIVRLVGTTRQSGEHALHSGTRRHQGRVAIN
jgi:hypothetical protein